MTANQSVQAELGAMREELVRGGGAAADEAGTPRDSGSSPSCGADLQSLVHELEAKWGDASESAEELVKSHPVAALASAFLVGLVLGRLMGHRS